MIVLGRLSDRSRKRKLFVAISCLIAAFGLLGAIYFGNNIVLLMIFITIAMVSNISSIPLFWSMPIAVLGGAAAAAGIAAINSIGNFSVFLSRPAMGWLSDVTHRQNASLYLLVIGCLANASLTITLPNRLVDK
jgi:nitrate/nitrite transporter NarK